MTTTTVAVAAHFLIGGRWDVQVLDWIDVPDWIAEQLAAGADHIRVAPGEWQLWSTERTS